MLADKHPYISLWFLFISTFSMLPLLIKDGLLIQYCGLSMIFLVITYFTSLQIYQRYQHELYMKLMFLLSLCGTVILTLCNQVVQPPERLPDLFPVLISAYSCVHFLFFLLIFHYFQFTNDGFIITDKKKKQHNQASKDKKVK